MHHSPKVFISVLNWNGLDDTIECLESVFKMEYLNRNVVVVDNASTDGSASIIQGMFPQVILIENKENLGFTGGHNVGIRYAIEHGADYVWLLNNDAIVEVETLSALIDAAEKDPLIGLISPQINDYSNPVKVQFRGSYFDWKAFEEISPSNNNNSDEVDSKFQTGRDVTLWGTALLIKRAVIAKVGYLDEKYFAYREDLDYSIRALKANFRNVLHSGARISHKNDPSMHENKSPYYYYYMLRNIYLLEYVYFQGWRRINMQRMYLAHVLGRISHIVKYRNGQKEHLVAVVSGAWHGVNHIGGRMSSSPKAPYILEKMILFFGSHPLYFWSHIIAGNFGLILKKLVSKIKISRTA